MREQGVVGLAIGFVLGGAVSKVVTALVNDIVNPLVGLALGKTEGLKTLKIAIGPVDLLIGDFVSVVIDFMVIAAVVYYGFKILGLEKLDKKKN